MLLKSPPARVLIVDDDPREREYLAPIIGALGYAVETATDGEDALEKLGTHHFDAIVTDLIMPRMDGIGLLRSLLERGDRTPAVVLTGFGDMDKAVSIVHELGAFWFLEKPAQSAALATLLLRAIRHKKLLAETERLQRQLSRQGQLGSLVGTSTIMRNVFSLIEQFAPSSAPVLITGESGTGKERIATEIHRLSPRADRPFVAINCAALPENLIESELFGHERGAYTGAVGRRAGCFEHAHEGTLFLDEIAEMPLAMQAKLLRVLEDSKVRRLGGREEMLVDVRVIAATNQSVPEALDRKVLRPDLYYRLNVFHLDLPPLRHRREDIPVLVEAIVRELNEKHGTRIAEVAPDVLDRLILHSWPGNIRELRNVLERAVIVSAGGTLHAAHLPPAFHLQQATGTPGSPITGGASITFEAGRRLSEVQQAYIDLTLKCTNNNKKRASELLGVSIRTLHSWLAAAAGRPPPTKRANAMGNSE